MPNSTLRPLGFGEILDGTFSLYRRNFASFYLTALLPYLPLMLLWIALVFLVPAGGSREVAAGIVQVVSVPYLLVVGLLVSAALTRMAASAYQGEPVSRGAAFRVAARRAFPLLGASILAGIVIVLGFVLFVVPGVLAMIALFAIVPVCVLEGRGAVESLGRSRALARGAWGRIFGVGFILSLIVYIPSMVVWGVALAVLIPQMAAQAASVAPGAAPVMATMQVLQLLVSAITVPFLMTGLVLLYFDRRVRAEGLDLEMAAQQLATVH